MLGESLYDSQNQLIESFVEVTAPVTFVGPTGLHLFGYDPTLGLVDANGNPITGGGGSPGSPDQSLQFNDAGSFAGNASLVRDATTGGLNLNAKVRTFGIADDGFAGENAFVVAHATLGETSIVISPNYTSATVWNGLLIDTEELSGGTILSTLIQATRAADHQTKLVLQAGTQNLYLSATNSGKILIGANSGSSSTLDITPASGILANYPITIKNAQHIAGDTTDAHAWSLNAYDVDGAATQKMIEFTNANAPTVNVTAPTGLQFNSLPIAFGFTNTAFGSLQTLGVKAGSGDPVLLLAHAYTSGSTWDGGWIQSAHRELALFAGEDGSYSGGQISLYTPTVVKDTIRFDADVTVASAKAIKSQTSDGNSVLFQAYDVDGGAQKTMMTMAAGNTPTLDIGGPSGTLTSVYANRLVAKADVDGTATMTTFTNATNATVTNAYVVNGGQAATTSNTGWIKIYVGTTVAWMPYWANATP